MPICKSLALNKKGRNVLLSHTRHRKFRVCYLISLRREWSYNILVEEDQKYNSNPIEALLFSGGVYRCALSTFHFQITPLHPGPSKSHFEKKMEVISFYFLKCNTEVLNIPLKYRYFDIYHFIHHQGFQVYHGGAGSCIDLAMENRGNKQS